METDVRYIPTEKEMRALQAACHTNAGYDHDDLRSLFDKLQPVVWAAEARRYYSLSPYEQGREAKAKGASIANSYLTGTLADKRWIAGYRGEEDPGDEELKKFDRELNDFVDKNNGVLIR